MDVCNQMKGEEYKHRDAFLSLDVMYIIIRVLYHIRLRGTTQGWDLRGSGDCVEGVIDTLDDEDSTRT